MNKVTLFDMDGTLTPPREKISQSTLSALKDLQRQSDIGIVTGSDIDYIRQQLKDLLDVGGVSPGSIHLFPCNGTKHYKWNGTSYQKVYDVDMIKTIGNDQYRLILQNILSYQLLITIKHELPYTGTFFDYRGSMLNWCPIGRSASKEEREAWVAYDKIHQIRKYIIEEIKNRLPDISEQLTFSIGGQISIDIFPKGWDKTYVVNHLSNYEEIIFVGDKCNPGGNDHAIYALLKDGIGTQSYSVESPEDTIKVIRQNILGGSR